jgi:tetratricopeptide (TPR) repeat protein
MRHVQGGTRVGGGAGEDGEAAAFLPSIFEQERVLGVPCPCVPGHVRGRTRGISMRHFPTLILVVLMLTWAGSSARAAETSEYTEAVNLGLAEFDEKNFAEARVHFARAHAIYPSARTLRALGMVQFELKNYVESAQFLEQALASQERRLEADKREKTEKLLARALGYIARLTLDIAPDTQVTVDGRPSNLSSGAELVLGVGEHVLEFRAPGRITDKRTLQIQGGEQEVLRVQLATVSEASPANAKNDDVRPGRPVYKNPWLWTAIGVVVVGAAVGTAVVLARDPETKMMEPDLGSSGVPALMGLPTK